MITHDRLIAFKLPSDLLHIIDERAAERRTNRSTCIRWLIVKALREDDVLQVMENLTNGGTRYRR